MKKTSEQLIAEIADVKEALRVSALKLHQLSNDLHEQNRRAQRTASTAAYTTTANGWMRLSSMITQGLKRSDLTERLVVRAKEIEAEEAKALKDRALTLQRRKEAIQNQLQSVGDLVELYGEDMIRHASE